MARYFNIFPKIGYDLQSENKLELITNIVSRFVISEKIKENAAVYYEYYIEDGETPEILAAKTFGSAEKHWIVLTMNNIIDPQFDWPLTYSQFNIYLNLKYSANNYADTANTYVSGLSWSQNLNNVHSYYKVVTKTVENTITVKKFQVDANTYANNTLMGLTFGAGDTYIFPDDTTVKIQITKETQSYYDYEMKINEDKKTIKLLKPEYANNLELELQSIFE